MNPIKVSSLKIISKNYEITEFKYTTKEEAELDLPTNPFTEDYVPVSENTPEGHKPKLNVVFILLEENKFYFWNKATNKLVPYNQMIEVAIKADKQVVFNGNFTTLSFPTDSRILEFGDKYWSVGLTIERDIWNPESTGFTTIWQSLQNRFIWEHTNEGFLFSSKATGHHPGYNSWRKDTANIPMTILQEYNPTNRVVTTYFKYNGNLYTHHFEVSESYFGAGEINGFFNIGKMENDPMNAWSSVNSKYSYFKGKVNNLIVKIGDTEATGHLGATNRDFYFGLQQNLDPEGNPLNTNYIKNNEGFYNSLSELVTFDNITVVDDTTITIHTEKGFFGDGTLKNGILEDTAIG